MAKPGLDSAKGGLSEVKTTIVVCFRCNYCFPFGSYVPIPGIDAAVSSRII